MRRTSLVLVLTALVAPVAADAQTASPRYVSGAEPGNPPEVLVTNPELRFLAYPRRSELGVRVATGDVNGDGVPELVTGRGSGGRPEVRVFDSNSGRRLGRIMAYRQSFRGGVYVATGDVNGDGTAEIITGAGPGGGPHIRVIDGETGSRLARFLAYPSTQSRGVFVAAGDIDGDGRAEIVTGPGPGARGGVRVFDGDGKRVDSFSAFGRSFMGGVFVGIAGDYNADGSVDAADYIVARASGPSPKVRVIDGASNTVLLSFNARGFGRGGLRVAGGDVNGDGREDILVSGAEGTTEPPRAFDRMTGARIPFAPAACCTDAADFVTWRIVR
jgi:hypothetical protein